MAEMTDLGLGLASAYNAYADLPAEAVPLCKDCRWYDMIFKGPVRAKGCTRPLSARTSLVDGALDDRLEEWASDERKPSRWFRRERCGPDGKFFKGQG